MEAKPIIHFTFLFLFFSFSHSWCNLKILTKKWKDRREDGIYRNKGKKKLRESQGAL